MGALPSAPHAPPPAAPVPNDDEALGAKAYGPHKSPRPRTPRSPARATNHSADPPSRVLLPVRYSTWVLGDLGENLERVLLRTLGHMDGLQVTRLPRAFLIEAREAPGPLLEAVHRAAMELERGVEQSYPVFHHQLGPVWTGTLQSVFA